MKTHAPIHPGEVLREDFLLPLGLSEYRLAKDIGVPPRRFNEVARGVEGLDGHDGSCGRWQPSAGR